MGISVALPGATSYGDRPEPTTADALERARGATDGELIRRVARRDPNAFEALYRRFARPVFGLALRRRGDRMRAEDAVQETFAAVWRSAQTYKPDRGAGAPWLYAVARNAIVDRSRSRSDLPEEIPDSPSPALEDLPENEREVLELAYYGNLSQSEVADFLNIPLGTVKTRTRSGLSRLADLLEGELQ